MEPFYYFIGIIIAAIIGRVAFSIGNIVINLQAQTKLLAMIAEKVGNTEADVAAIIGKRNMPKKKVEKVME